MKTYKSFSIFKKKESDKAKLPTHSISANIGTQEEPEYVDIGACWVKEGNKGKFLSAKLQDAWTNSETGKKRNSFVIVDEDELNSLLEFVKGEKAKIIDPLTGQDLTPNDSSSF